MLKVLTRPYQTVRVFDNVGFESMLFVETSGLILLALIYLLSISKNTN